MRRPPCCLQIFAAFAGAIGVTALGLNESVVLYALQAFALLSVIGLAFGARRHRSIAPVALGSVSTAALFFAFHATFFAAVVYLGVAGLCLASVWNYFIWYKCRRDGANVRLKSVMTWPKCGYRKEETMPMNACLFFDDCSGCGARLKQTAGNCCVFVATDLCRATRFKAARPPTGNGIGRTWLNVRGYNERMTV